MVSAAIRWKIPKISLIFVHCFARDNSPNADLKSRRISSALPFFLFLALWLYQYFCLPAELSIYATLLSSSFESSQGKCRLPVLNPYDPSILSYISKATPVTCKRLQPSFTFVDYASGELVLNLTELAAEGYTRDQLTCTYRCIFHDSGVGDDTVKHSELQPLTTERLKLTCEFVEVTCSKVTSFLGQTVQIYRYHHALIIPKREEANSVFQTRENPRLSVLIFGIDSMSLSNMVRQLPETLRFLENELGSVVMHGQTKVGDNTWINTMAFLTGKLVQSTKEFPTELDDSDYARFFDDWAPFIWKNFSAAGYVGLYGEDRPDIANFNYAPKRGFLNPPTFHYARPFWLSIWWSFLHMRSSAFCYNTVPEHVIHIDYLKDFVIKYAKARRPTFAYHWSSGLSHDVLNKIGAADLDIRDFLRDTKPYLNNTVLLFLSDHGHRYDNIRQSVIGRLEARMPFLSVSVPKWFLNEHPEVEKNLAANSQRLTAQFDVFKTMADILKGDFADFRKPLAMAGSGLSLFRPIPEERHCFAAKIPEEYCPCYEESPVLTTDPKVTQVGNFLISHVNRLLRDYQPRPCAVLSLAAVKDAFLFVPRRKMLQDPQVGGKVALSGIYLSYRVQLEASPSGALFEAVVKYMLDTQGFVIEGDVDRNNKYGNTSACVTDTTLKKYCYCI